MDFKFGLLLFVSAYICTCHALPPCTCTRNYLPVCGSDNETYSNPCMLDCARYKSKKEITLVREGSCDDPQAELESCICTFIYRPVCGNDGVTYASRCNLDCQKQRSVGLEMSHEGACAEEVQEPACACTRDSKFVCGSDGKTYSNACLLNCATKDNSALSISHEGPCEDKVKVEEPACVCTRDSKFVCGSDGKTYSNACLLNCATKDNSALSISHEGPCEDKVEVAEPPCVCTREEKPVCGSDGNTYSNDCMLNCATKDNSMLSISHEGPCEDKVKVAEPTCACTRDSKFVCGSDGKTYSNACLLNCATKDNSALSISHEGPCEDGVQVA